ncbi:MAG: 2-C-methyl-D-erythritol 4-phosphate cytidylyltransferase [Parachlamydiaceae bacterium]
MISVIILAAGSGLRMGIETPKQYLPLGTKTVIDYSLDWAKAFDQVIVVADKKYHGLFPDFLAVEGGKRRQDSVYNGLKVAKEEFILIHDAARPFTKREDIEKLINEGKKTGAAALARPVPYTIKEADAQAHVIKTLDRSKLWEMQTPQFIRRDLLLKGYENVYLHNLEVTDDVSIVETIGAKVKLVLGSSFNFKISTMEDYKIAEALVGRI